MSVIGDLTTAVPSPFCAPSGQREAVAEYPAPGLGQCRSACSQGAQHPPPPRQAPQPAQAPALLLALPAMAVLIDRQGVLRGMSLMCGLLLEAPQRVDTEAPPYTMRRSVSHR